MLCVSDTTGRGRGGYGLTEETLITSAYDVLRKNLKNFLTSRKSHGIL